MESGILMIKSVFIFFCFWGLAMLLLWFRPKIDFFWKLIATIIFVFYIWFFFSELKTGFTAFKNDWYISILDFIKDFITIIFASMFIIWPVSIVIIFYKANDMGAEKLLKFLCILTLLLWIIFIIYFFFNEGIYTFFYESLKKMVPGAEGIN
jgi:hypothetical protein